MAPTKFQIYVDDSVKQRPVVPAPPQPPQVQVITHHSTARYKPEVLPPNQRFYFDERSLYPHSGGEFSFEEINLNHWRKRQARIEEKRRQEELQRENEELKQKVEFLLNQVNKLMAAQENEPEPMAIEPAEPTSPVISSRQSMVPQSLQPAQGDMSQYGALCDAPTVVRDLWQNTAAFDKFTLPVDQSQYIRDNVPTSTPAAKRAPASSNDENDKRSAMARRLSRPSMGGSPTLKLSPITETSRDCNSKSSSSSSAMSATPNTAKKLSSPVPVSEEPDQPLNPNDPTTYKSLLKYLPEPLDRRPGYNRLNRSMPKIRQGACFKAGLDEYLVDKELSSEAKVFTAQLLNDDSNNSADIAIKTICFRVDQPANEWLYYICNELHRRLVKQKSKPDIELSVMIANPAVMYNDGSILVDEYYRFVSLQHLIDACLAMEKPFPKAVAAYIALELLQVVRQIHTCDIIHMNINPENVLITCCPSRDDIATVLERTSLVKLIGFERAMDTRLLPPDFKFEGTLEHMVTPQMIDSKPWAKDVDWFGLLDCIYRMFFLKKISYVRDSQDKWTVTEMFRGDSFPTGIWKSLFEELLNFQGLEGILPIIDRATDELSAWIKANISFVLKEADSLETILEQHKA